MQHQSSVAQRSESPAAPAPIVVTLPDGKHLEFAGPVTGNEIAAAIGPDLARAAIEEALSLTEDERRNLARRAMAHVAIRYTRQAMCARTIQVYEELLFPNSSDVDVAAQ